MQEGPSPCWCLPVQSKLLLKMFRLPSELRRDTQPGGNGSGLSGQIGAGGSEVQPLPTGRSNTARYGEMVATTPSHPHETYQERPPVPCTAVCAHLPGAALRKRVWRLCWGFQRLSYWGTITRRQHRQSAG